MPEKTGSGSSSRGASFGSQTKEPKWLRCYNNEKYPRINRITIRGYGHESRHASRLERQLAASPNLSISGYIVESYNASISNINVSMKISCRNPPTKKHNEPPRCYFVSLRNDDYTKTFFVRGPRDASWYRHRAWVLPI